MGSLTIRKLDEAMKARLRLRAARNGRSVEEEARTILRDAAADAESPPAADPTPTEAPSAAAAAAKPARVLLVIGGGIAAYKSLDLIRRLRERGIAVRCVLTRAGSEFITPLSVGAIAGERPYTDLFNPDHEFDVGHIRLARDTDLVIVAPATADLMAKMANGHADDLATAVLLATDKPILLAPAMNPRMWANKATQRNVTRLQNDGVTLVGPGEGEMAERRERGRGRMAEPLEIAARVTALLAPQDKPLAGYRMLITSGPTHEPIDPVRYIANRSSGKQGHAIAAAAAAAGAEVTLVSGPVTIPDPNGITVVHVESAREMLAAVEKAMPADIAIFAAAVADWRVARDSEQKIKKQTGAATPELSLTENPDILATISKLPPSRRPPLVIGFAAETEHVERHAREKLARKGCDWIVANDVSPATGIMGGDSNTVHLISATGIEHWPPQSKDAVAQMLIEHIARTMLEKMKAKS